MTRHEILSDGVELWHGDNREILPSIEGVGSIITDPPYEDELHKSFGSIKITDGRERHPISDLGFDGINKHRSEYAKMIVDKSTRWAVIFCIPEGIRAWRDDLQEAGAKWDTPLAWIKPTAAPRFNGQGAARGFECMATAWCGPGHKNWNGRGKRGIYTHSGDRDQRHPTQKPLPLMIELINDYTNPNELVCDPFAGSATTGVACVRTGRRFVGVEKDLKFFELALRRLSGAVRQGDLFAIVPVGKKEKPPSFL